MANNVAQFSKNAWYDAEALANKVADVIDQIVNLLSGGKLLQKKMYRKICMDSSCN